MTLRGAQRAHAHCRTLREAWWGIINVTPDSFSDGGCYLATDAALARARALVAAGAHGIDLGGVSTRPGAPPVAHEEELARVLPALRLLRADLPPEVLVSLDTSSPRVALAAAQEGLIDVINDVWAGRVEESGATTISVAAECDLGLVLMHMQGDPGTMQTAPRYNDCVAEVGAFLAGRLALARASGVRACILDPGIGFGKTLEHNVALLSEHGIGSLSALGAPVLVGLSRKRFLNELAHGNLHTHLPLDARDAASKEWEARCLAFGARIIRTHRMPLELTGLT